MHRRCVDLLRAAALALILCQPVGAQPLQQSGGVTPGHPWAVISNGVAGDGGTATQGKLTGLGVTASGPSICANSGPVTGAYNQICLGVTTSGGGTISFNNFGGSGGLSFMANGSPATASVFGLGTMATQNANSVAISGGSIIGLPTPSTASAAATKQYVDTLASGFVVHPSVSLATTGALAAYTWSSTGGGTLTAIGNGALTVDSVAVSVSQRILVKNEASSGSACNGNINSACDGVYTVQQTGDGSNPYILQRASSLNSKGGAENTAAGWPGADSVFVTSGTVNANTTWVNTTPIVTLNQTAFLFTQFSNSASSWQISGGNIYYNGGNVGIGTASPSGLLEVASGTLYISGGITAPAWTTNGIRLKEQGSQTFTDTTSSGTVAAAYTNFLSGGTIAANSSTTYTKYFNAFFGRPSAGTNVTIGTAYSIGTAGTVEIDPPQPSAVQGLIINQFGPQSGTLTQEFDYNLVAICCDNQNANAPSTRASGFTVNFSSGGTNDQGTKTAGRFSHDHNSATVPSANKGDHVGLDVLMQGSVNDGGTTPGSGMGTLYGMSVGAFATSGATFQGTVSGMEVDAEIFTGASADHRWSFSAVDFGQVQGSVSDAAYELGGTGQIGFKNAIMLDSLHGGPPLSTNGCVICNDGASATIATFADFASYTISGNILHFANFTLTGAGAFTAKGASTINTGAAGTVLTLQNTAGTCTHTPTSGSETVSCSSDARLKMNVQDAGSALDRILAYKIRQYDTRSDGAHHSFGVVAQEMSDTRMVHEKDGAFTVDQPNPWEIVKAIQELRELLDRNSR